MNYLIKLSLAVLLCLNVQVQPMPENVESSDENTIVLYGLDRVDTDE